MPLELRRVERSNLPSNVARAITTNARRPKSDPYEAVENSVAVVATALCARRRHGTIIRHSLGLVTIIIGNVAGKPHVSHTGVKIMRGMPIRHN